jgi:hypothetical protein
VSRPGPRLPSDYGFEAQDAGAARRPDIAAPPRRLAVGDPGFHRFGPMLRVLLDGEEVKRCTAYDADKGVITRLLLDAAGRIFVDADTQKVATETLTGAVKVQWR